VIAAGLPVSFELGRHLPYGAIIPIGFFAIAGLILYRIDCPRCGTHVGYGGKFKGVRVRRGFLDTHCNECGYDLNNSRSV
jgi:hypothetical protein